jgi:HK97 family phage prohead protease
VPESAGASGKDDRSKERDEMSELANRAYSAIEVKAVDENRRIFRGVATTPTTDRVGDNINPMGASFTNPLTLLHGHRHDSPIGTVKFSKPTKNGIEFEAEIPNIDEPGPLKDRVDTAWGEIKHKLVRAVSVGFRPTKYAFKDDGGVDFQEIEIYELSTVAIPANAQALITSVKAMQPLGIDVVQEIRQLQERQVNGGVRLPQARKDTSSRKNADGSIRLR